MRIDGFLRSLLFGGAAAIGLVFALHLAAPILGASSALALYLVASLVLYAAGLGATPRGRLRNALVAAAGAVLVGLLASNGAGLVIGLAVVLGGVRSGLERTLPTVRAWAVEVLLGLGALAFASWIGSPGWLGMAASLWGFALVQSLYFLVPGRRPARRNGHAGDPFERAHERLLGLLEEA